TGEGVGTKRHDIRAPTRIAQSFVVALERFELGEQIMREINWLGTLQMGIAGHQDLGMFLREQQERILQSAETRNDFINFFPHIEAKIERNLIVAAASRVQ